MKFLTAFLVLSCATPAFAKVETICGTLAFARFTGEIFDKHLTYSDYQIHEIRNEKDKTYYQILDGEELAEKSKNDKVCITGEVVVGDPMEELSKDGSRSHKIRLKSFRDAD